MPALLAPRRTQGFDTTGIEFVGPNFDANAEAVAALRPDLIVGHEFDEDVVEILGRIAPFVGVNVLGRPLTEALADFGELTGRTARAQELRGGYETRVASLRERLTATHPNLTVSMVVPLGDGTFVLLDTEGGAVGTVADDLELGRPAAQAGTPRSSFDGGPFSLELVADHDADVVLVADLTGDSPGDTRGQDFIAQPLVQQLEAARRGQLHLIDISTTVGAAWQTMETFLDVCEERLLADGLVSTGVNA